jgi:prepilin-type N-terminal cleavage/methylation domain-containing protein
MRDGFSLVEILVALVILTIGILGMAGTTGYLATRVKHAGAATERAAAVQQVAERLRSLDFNNIETKVRGQAEFLGNVEVWWNVSSLGSSAKHKQVEVFTCGTDCRAKGGQVGHATTSIIEIYKQ